MVEKGVRDGKKVDLRLCTPRNLLGGSQNGVIASAPPSQAPEPPKTTEISDWGSDWPRALRKRIVTRRPLLAAA